jgi:DNA-binding NarL/FixJ family response regulator
VAEGGWRAPLAWDDIDTDPDSGPRAPRPAHDDGVDDIAIERAIAGDGIRLANLTLTEQQVVIAQLTQRGRSIRDIARQLDTNKRTVSRRRASIPGR